MFFFFLESKINLFVTAIIRYPHQQNSHTLDSHSTATRLELGICLSNQNVCGLTKVEKQHLGGLPKQV